MIKNNKTHPWNLTGLIDAEGSLGVNILRDNTRKSKYAITFFFRNRFERERQSHIRTY